MSLAKRVGFVRFNAMDSSLPPPYDRPPPVMSQASPVRARRGGWGWIITTLILVAVVVFLLFGRITDSLLGLGGGGWESDGDLEEVVVEQHRSPNKIAVIEVSGIISSQAWDGSGRNMVRLIRDQLKMAQEDPDVRAVVLKVDSPGGEVMASDDIARSVRDFQGDGSDGDEGKPVVAVMGGVAASGGYYISAPARWIVANEMTITGSIGVIMHSFNYRGLLDKVELYPQVFKSGRLKDMLSGSKKMEDVDPEEKQIIQDMVNATYERFKSVVLDGRAKAWKDNSGDGRELVSDWVRYADGRVITGAQAYEFGFVDELGTSETAVDRAMELAGISEANLIEYREPVRLFSFLNLLGESRARGVKLDLGLDFPRLETGRLYFISSTVLF